MFKRLICLFLSLCLCITTPVALADSLQNGSTGSDVTALQERLIALGLLSGSADGIYGSMTTTAITEAQRLLTYYGYDVEQTGIADDQTITFLNNTNLEGLFRSLVIGSTGDNVLTLQSRLVDLNLLTTADGVYGQNTQTAVQIFQQNLIDLGITGISATGIADLATQTLMMSDLSAYGYEAPIFFDESDPLSLTVNHLYAEGLILMDAPSGEILFSNNEDTILYPASTTKIMTLLLALDLCDPYEMIVVPDCAQDVPSDSSLVPVYAGEEMPMIDLLYGLMIRSGNDAANAIAELCSGSVDAFVAKMNEKASELGMTHTHYANPHGYHDPDHYTTAEDMAILAREALTRYDFCQIALSLSYTMSATQNRDELLLQSTVDILNPSSDYYIPGAAGVKRGYTSAAGFCYVGAYQMSGRTLIAVVLNVPSSTRAWSDLRRLFAYGMATDAP